MAVGVVAQPPACGGREGGAARRPGQLDDFLGAQAADRQVFVGDALPAAGQAVAGAQHDEDLVAPQPSDDEDEGAGGGVVHPLCVVEHEDDRAGALQLAEHRQQFGADGQGIGVGDGPVRSSGLRRCRGTSASSCPTTP